MTWWRQSDNSIIVKSISSSAFLKNTAKTTLHLHIEILGTSQPLQRDIRQITPFLQCSRETWKALSTIEQFHCHQSDNSIVFQVNSTFRIFFHIARRLYSAKCNFEMIRNSQPQQHTYTMYPSQYKEYEKRFHQQSYNFAATKVTAPPYSNWLPSFHILHIAKTTL